MVFWLHLFLMRFLSVYMTELVFVSKATVLSSGWLRDTVIDLPFPPSLLYLGVVLKPILVRICSPSRISTPKEFRYFLLNIESCHSLEWLLLERVWNFSCSSLCLLAAFPYFGLIPLYLILEHFLTSTSSSLVFTSGLFNLWLNLATAFKIFHDCFS